MKKKVLSILTALLLLPLLCGAQNQSSQLHSLVGNYKGTEGFEVISIGRPFIGLAKLFLRTQVEDAEEKALLDALGGVSRLTVVDYEDAPAKVKAEFARKVSRILKDEDLLMEAVDGTDKVCIYGILSEDGNTIRDVILHEKGDGSLISFTGSIQADKIGTLIAHTNH